METMVSNPTILLGRPLTTPVRAVASTCILPRTSSCFTPLPEKLLRRRKEYQEKLTVVKIDHDANPRLIDKYKVYGLPTLILFKNGEEVAESRREGAITKVKLKEYVDGLLQSLSVS